MALDHYVSQVHLKQFLRQSDRKLLLATRKSDLSTFTPRPRDVCRIEDGSTNEYLTENRVVEDFLRDVEPAYEPCLARIADGKLDWNSRQVFSGFLAYIQTYTPAALRMFDPMVRAMLERTIKQIENSGELEPLDLPELSDWHGKSVSQLMVEGKLELEIDLKMPQAMATTQLFNIRYSLASSDVTILRPGGRSRFLTSDFPSIILGHHENKFAQRFIPISPKLGLVFHTHTSIEERDQAHHRFVDIGAKKVQRINDEIIRSAENLVFLRSGTALGRVQFGSGASDNFDGVIYDDASNRFVFVADGDDDGTDTGNSEIHVARLRILSTTDASETSTLQGLKIGPSTGTNLIADNNEIMVRDGVGGGPATLYLNSNGGPVKIAGEEAWHAGNLEFDVNAPSRSHSTIYQNTSGKLMMVVLGTGGSGAAQCQVASSSGSWKNLGYAAGLGGKHTNTFLVPNTWRWRINGTATVYYCQELELG